jgi:hypothetical protein
LLARYGLDDLAAMGGRADRPLQQQAVGLLHAVQYLKIPVIVANSITIVFEIFLGG